MDFHFRRVDGQEVNFQRKSNFGVTLTKDDRGTSRHETLSMNKLAPGKYILYVNNFTRDAHITRSQAVVKMTFNGRQVASASIPTNDTNAAHVNWIVGLFEFDAAGGKFVPGNVITDANGINGFFTSIHVIGGGSGPAAHAPAAHAPAARAAPAGLQIKNQELKLELQWSPPNRDLDFYFRRSDGQQVNYSKKNNFDNKVQLLKDDQGQSRHETLAFHRLNTGKFVLFVNNFSKDAHLSRSNAYVQILIGGQLKETVRIPNNDTNPANVNWLVASFDFNTGVYTKINKLVSNSSPEIYGHLVTISTTRTSSSSRSSSSSSSRSFSSRRMIVRRRS